MEPKYFLGLVFGVILFYIMGRVFLTPLKWAARLVINATLGAIAIWIWDLALGHSGLGIGVNVVSTVTVAVLGAPGFFLLLAIKFFNL